MNSEIESALGFNLHAPLKTIHSYLMELNPPMLHMLDDELIEIATKEIRPEGKARKMFHPSKYQELTPIGFKGKSRKKRKLLKY